MKTPEEHFRDWENEVFGYGYGTGEYHTVPVLKRFLELCRRGTAYDYRVLEAELTAPVAWLLINILARHDVGIIGYGSSPRYGWLTARGKKLRAFTEMYSAAALVHIVTAPRSERYIPCDSRACTCEDEGCKKHSFWAV